MTNTSTEPRWHKESYEYSEMKWNKRNLNFNNKRLKASFFDYDIIGINFYSCTRYKLLCNYDSSSSSDTGSEEE